MMSENSEEPLPGDLQSKIKELVGQVVGVTKENNESKEFMHNVNELAEIAHDDSHAFQARLCMVECGLIKKIASYLGALDLTLDSMIPDTVKSLRTFVIRKKMLAMLGDISEEEELQVTLLQHGVIPPLANFMLYAKPGAERKSAMYALYRLSEHALIQIAIMDEINKYSGDFSVLRRSLVTKSTDASEKEWFVGIMRFTGVIPDKIKPGRPFYEPSEFFFCKELEAKFPIIKKEFEELKNAVLVAWPERYLCKKGWDVLGLFAFNNKIEQNCNLCPETVKILESLPGMTTAMFSCLQPKAHIKPHVGYYQYSEKILRCHLGITVPPGCWLKVNSATQGWEEGKCMVFDDTFTHEALNPSDEMRVVLMMDFLWDRKKKCLKDISSLGENSDVALISKDLLKKLESFGKSDNVKERPNALGYIPKPEER